MPIGTHLEIPASYPDNALTRAIFAPVEHPAFHLTAAQAVDLSSMTPMLRELALSDLYNAYLHERISDRCMRYARYATISIAQSWDRKGAEYMEAARAEYRRALAAAREAA